MVKLKNVKVNLTLPFIGSIEGIWEPDEKEECAAWELYIELITRISVAELKSDEGLLREALSSMHTIFSITRDILKKYGASIAKPKGDNHISFGYLAVAILNNVLRPLLSKWHPILLDYEQRKANDISITEHERKWEKNRELREALNGTRFVLIQYSDLLAQVAGVPSLVIRRN
jgi:hypothetical protein